MARPSPRSPLFALLIAVLFAFTLGSDVERFNASRVGLIDLPDIPLDALPAFCLDFTSICALESAGNYESAFAWYEERYHSCGLAGWSLQGSGHGLDATVGFKTTPCGTRVAVKGTQKQRVLEHIERECAALKALGDGNATSTCPGCFARYYYYSKISGACYSEFMHVVPAEHVFNKTVFDSRPTAKLPMAKEALLAGFPVIAAMRAHNIEHRDFTFRNVYFQAVHVDNRTRLRVVALDFGASKGLEEPTLVRLRAGHPSGNRGHSDFFTWIHDVYNLVYVPPGHDAQYAVLMAPGGIDTVDPSTLLHALVTLMLKYKDDPNCAPDFEQARELILAATSL